MLFRKDSKLFELICFYCPIELFYPFFYHFFSENPLFLTSKSMFNLSSSRNFRRNLYNLLEQRERI